jgi:hypothetical protein
LNRHHIIIIIRYSTTLDLSHHRHYIPQRSIAICLLQ